MRTTFATRSTTRGVLTRYPLRTRDLTDREPVRNFYTDEVFGEFDLVPVSIGVRVVICFYMTHESVISTKMTMCPFRFLSKVTGYVRSQSAYTEVSNVSRRTQRRRVGMSSSSLGSLPRKEVNVFTPSHRGTERFQYQPHSDLTLRNRPKD